MTKFRSIIDKIEDLHRPIIHIKSDESKWVMCNSCKITYPCPTIQIITDGVKKPGD